MSFSKADPFVVRDENIRLRRETFVFVRRLYEEVQPLILSVFKDFNLGDRAQLLSLSEELISKAPADRQLAQSLLIFHQIVVISLGELIDADTAEKIVAKRLAREGITEAKAKTEAQDKIKAEKEAIAQFNSEVLLSIIGDIMVSFNIEKQVDIANAISGYPKAPGRLEKAKRFLGLKKPKGESS